MLRNSKNNYLKIIVPLLTASVICLIIFWLWLRLEIARHEASQLQFTGIEQSKGDKLIRQILTVALILSPTLLIIIYSRSKLLTKYIIRQITLPFSYSLGGFIAIWLVIDLIDKGRDLAKAGGHIRGLA